jgi:mannose-6-phosphate isomerase-like protein (cupin superfamily)
MARSKVKARTNRPAVKRSAPLSRRATKSRAAKPRTAARRRHDFVKSHLDPADFKTDGLRPYALYRDLGIKKATRGMAVAHVIRLLGKCDPQVVSKWHYHAADFQMIYVLKGTVTTEMEGHGAHTLKAGDAWLQPPSLVHRVLDYSDGCELLEIVLPGDFKTVELEK